MNYRTNLAIKPEYWDYEESPKNNVVTFRRRESHDIVEAEYGDKDMSKINEKNLGQNKAVILVRVSSREQKEGYSIDAQLTRLRKYCEQKGLEVIKEFVIVESSTRGEREKFYEMINFIKKQKETINLVCDKVDRLQRSFKEMPIIDELRRSGKLILHFFVEGQILDANSNSSQIMAYQMYIMMAESYTNSISDNVKRSFERMRQEGKITGTAPIGYLNKNDGRGKTDIILDPDRAFLVKRIFEEYATSLYSMQEIRKKTIEWNLKNKTKSDTYLSVSQIEKILKNPFYYGVARYKGKEYKHIYPRLIDKELFEKCDDVRNGRHRNRSNTTKTEFIFKGMIKCKNCGCTVTPELKKGKYVYLRPNSKEGCTCKQINETVALEEVEKVLNSMVFPKNTLEQLKSTLKNAIEAKSDYSQNYMDKLANDIKSLEKKSDRILNLYIDESITKDEYNKKKEELFVLKDNIQAQITKLNEANDDFEITVEYLLDIASRSYSLFKSSGIDVKRKILKLVFPNFYLDGQNLSYDIRKPFDLFIKGSTYPINLGRKDSNLRMPGPKPGALPLGDAPIFRLRLLL
jgi:cassette chromosome recombinase B